MFRLPLVVTLLLIGLVACAPATTPDQRNPPTLAAPAWTDSAAPITLENAPQLAYLGRLDQAEAMATVFAYALSPDSLNLAGLAGENLIGWDLLTGERSFTNARLDTVRLVYSSDKTEIFGVDASGDLRILDAATGVDRYRARGHNDFSGASAFAPDYDLIGLGGDDGSVKVWDLIARESRVTFNAGGLITALAFSPSAALLLTADSDGWVRVWEWETGTLNAEFQYEMLGGGRLSASRAAFASDGVQFATVTDVDVRLHRLDSERVISLRLSEGGRSPLVQFSPDGRYIVTGSETAGLALWNTADGSLVARLPQTEGTRISAVFSPDATMLVTTALNRSAALWDVTAISQSGAVRSALPVASTTLLEAAWTSDGRLILFFDAGGAVYIWGIPARSSD